MVEDRNYLKVRRYILTFVLLFFFFFLSFSENLSFNKINNLYIPCVSFFINEDELIVTEKSGQIKIINISNGSTEIVKHNLNFTESGQGGLLDILYKNNKVWI